MATLTGSEKQVAFAGKIRSQAISEITAMLKAKDSEVLSAVERVMADPIYGTDPVRVYDIAEDGTLHTNRKTAPEIDFYNDDDCKRLVSGARAQLRNALAWLETETKASAILDDLAASRSVNLAEAAMAYDLRRAHRVKMGR